MKAIGYMFTILRGLTWSAKDREREGEKERETNKDLTAGEGCVTHIGIHLRIPTKAVEISALLELLIIIIIYIYA